MFSTAPAASFAHTPAEIAGAPDKFKPNNYLQHTVTLSGVKVFLLVGRVTACTFM